MTEAKCGESVVVRLRGGNRRFLEGIVVWIVDTVHGSKVRVLAKDQSRVVTVDPEDVMPERP